MQTNPLSAPLDYVVKQGYLKPETLMEFIASMQTDPEIIACLAAAESDIREDELCLHMIGYAHEYNFSTYEGSIQAMCM